MLQVATAEREAAQAEAERFQRASHTGRDDAALAALERWEETVRAEEEARFRHAEVLELAMGAADFEWDHEVARLP